MNDHRLLYNPTKMIQSDTSTSSNQDISELLNKKIQEIDNLLLVCEKLTKDIGRKRLVDRFIAEKKVLLKHLRSLGNINEEHLRSSNVPHLSSVLWCALTSTAVVEILKPFVLTDEHGAKLCRIFVDVVADSGNTWIKVVARNPQAILQSEIGAVSFGRKTLVEQIEQLKECAKKNRHLFQIPKVKVLFAAGVLPEIKSTLERQGVEILETMVYPSQLCVSPDGNANSTATNRVSRDVELIHKQTETTDFNNSSSTVEKKVILSNLKLHQVPQNAMLNLDVSTMIAYVSSLTNGHRNFKFQSAVLSEQAEREQYNPVKPCLDELFEGKKLVCCTTAFKDFSAILSTIGGEREKERAEKFLAIVDVINDQPSAKAFSLGKSCKVRTRPQVVFGTGDTLQAVTVTANKGFLRAASAQGINFVAFLHESRALTEAAEETAQKLDDSSK